MEALQLTAWQTEPELREVSEPQAGPGEALVRVEAAGLCHTDLHIMDWPEGTLPWDLPFTLGHECAGTVAALGPGATGIEVGERVVVYGPWGCGACAACARGAENLCPTRQGRGVGCGLDGALAGCVRVPSTRLLVPIGDLDAAQAAPLTDAALTPYHAISGALERLRPGTTAVVIGVGGLGRPAIRILRLLSPSRVVTVDPRPEARARALESGAHAALDSVGLDPADVRAETDGGATLVLDFVGSDETLRLGVDVLAMGGHLSLVGHGGGVFPVPLEALPYDSSVSRPSWGTLPELREVVALARSGGLTMDVETFALGDALEAYRRLRAGEIAGRAVVIP